MSGNPENIYLLWHHATSFTHLQHLAWVSTCDMMLTGVSSVFFSISIEHLLMHSMYEI